MFQLLSEYLGLNSMALDDLGVFNPVLDHDSRYFIDPKLIEMIEIDEFSHSYSKIIKHYTNIIKLIKLSKSDGDLAYRSAIKLMDFSEFKGIRIGYAKNNIKGSGIGIQLKKCIIKTIQEITSYNIEDPHLFELLGVIQDGIGMDRISDMIANIIKDDIYKYTNNINRKLGITDTLVSDAGISYYIQIYDDGFPILLLPKCILSKIPTALYWEDRDYIIAENEKVRGVINKMIGYSWKVATRKPKRTLLNAFRLDPSLVKDLVNKYNEKEPTPYDFEDDPAGEYLWLKKAREVVNAGLIVIDDREIRSEDDVYCIVLDILTKFKGLIENNALWQLLYDNKGEPKKEKSAQLLLYGISRIICEKRDIDVSPESNSGRGPVDFKYSKGFYKKVLVEIKLTTNSKIYSGYERQLVAYANAEDSKTNIYMVIDVESGNRSVMRRLQMLKNRHGDKLPTLMFVDARRKLSASRLR